MLLGCLLALFRVRTLTEGSGGVIRHGFQEGYFPVIKSSVSMEKLAIRTASSTIHSNVLQFLLEHHMTVM